MFSVPQYTTSELQQYNYFVMQEPVFEEKIEEPVFTHVYEENGVLYCASSTSEGVYWYTYCLNNPLIYTDPSGYSTKDFIDHIVSIINGSAGVNSWTASGGFQNGAPTLSNGYDDASGGGAGWGGGSGGGSWQSGYNVNISIDGKPGRFKKSGLQFKKYIWQPGNLIFSFSIERGEQIWVPNEGCSIYTPIEPTPWLYQPVDYISSQGIEMTGSGSGGGSSNGASIGGPKLATSLSAWAISAGLNSFNDAGMYLHYLPKSNKLVRYNHFYVNQHTKNMHIYPKGALVLFGINQTVITSNYFRGNTDSDIFISQTILNSLSSVNPAYAALSLAFDIMQFIENVWDNYMSRPNKLNEFNYNFGNAYEDWQRNMMGDY